MTTRTIRISGVLDEVFVDAIQLERVLSSVETGEVERPEVEVVDRTQGTEVHLGALYCEGHARPVGWLVTLLETSGIHRAVCISTGGDEREELLFCGAPENVLESAILSKEEVLRLVPRLLDAGGDAAVSFRPLQTVLGHS